MAVESVSGCSWNECPDQRGISVRMSVEWVSEWSWNPQYMGAEGQEIDHWHGKRLKMSTLGQSHPQEINQGWAVNAHDIRAIARTLSQAFQSALKTLPPPRPANDSFLGLRVLIAEDNPVNRTIFREQLEALGAWVVVAEDGEHALQRWSPEIFDLVITDINMPKLNGYGLARALRVHDTKIPIIGVTANALREEGELCATAGMDAWVVKPLSLDTLRKILLQHCGHKLTKQRATSLSLQRHDMTWGVGKFYLQQCKRSS